MKQEHGFIQFLHVHPCHNRNCVCMQKWIVMALENDKGICPGYLAAENI